MLSAVTLPEFTLMFRDNLIKVIIHLIKHTPFINFGENGKDANGTIIFDIKFAVLFINGYKRSGFFNSEGKMAPQKTCMTPMLDYKKITSCKTDSCGQ